MSLQKNGVSFNRAFDKAIAYCTALLCLTGLVSSVSAAYDPCCYDSCYQDQCCYDPCGCDMPNFVVYADFIYWQVHPEGLEFVLKNGLTENSEAVNKPGSIVSPDCELEPGFRIGLVVDLGCCDWDFYAQYTWLHPCFQEEREIPFTQNGFSDADFLLPIISNGGLGSDEELNLARAEWDAHYNVFDFGLGRTFSVNCCFDFRPHLGFKATWQELKYNVRYEQVQDSVEVNRIDILNKTNFDGIGLRGGFDAAWRFSSCFSLVGGLAISSVWSDIEVHRQDYATVLENGQSNNTVNILDLENDRCALIPVTELLLGLRYDTTMCDCYDVFVFVGWENQVWWNLNRFLFVDLDAGNRIQFGPHGNVTYQGLTVRAGLGF